MIVGCRGWGDVYNGYFFQAEDGIRVLVRCRGVGDGYKGQRGGSEAFARR